MNKLHPTANEIISHQHLLINASMSLPIYTLIVQISKYMITITLN